MSLIKRTRGTGITKRDFYSVCLEKGDRFENAQLMRMLFQHIGKSFDQRLDEIDAAARTILSAARLPTRPDRHAYDRTGNECRVSQPSGKPRYRSESKLIATIADANRFEYDSPEGYAARIVDRTSAIRRARAEGNSDDACRSCICLGSLLTEFDLKTGTAEGPSRGGIKGSKARWSHHDKTHRQETLRQAFLKARKGGLPKMEAYAQTARKTGASIRAVQRAVAN